MVSTIKLWPSRTGILHGVRDVEDLGAFIRITTHCGSTIMARTSRRSRAARWLRNRWTKGICRYCRIPEWKIKRYVKSAQRMQRLQTYET